MLDCICIENFDLMLCFGRWILNDKSQDLVDVMRRRVQNTNENENNELKLIIKSFHSNKLIEFHYQKINLFPFD